MSKFEKFIITNKFFQMNPPVDESAINYAPYTERSDSIETVQGENTSGSSLTASIMLSGITDTKTDEVRKSRKRWSWFHYIIWIIPTVWSSIIYFIQLIYGGVNIPLSENYLTYSVSVYNFVSGFIGLSLITLKCIDNWAYIKPASWLTEKDLEESDNSCCYDWSMFFAVSLLDIFLFVWTILGSLWTMTLYGSELIYDPAFMVFSIVNIVLQYSKYGIIMFSLKVLFSWKSLQLLKYVRLV
jgi:hypothetical protein